MLARVHIAKTRIGMDEDTYRAMLVNSFGADSAGKLNPDVLRQLMQVLEREARQKARAPYPGRPRNIEASGEDESSRSRQLRKIEALLAEANLPWAYADGIARRVCKTDKAAWVETGDLHKIIAALVKHAQRNGRRTR
jgi:phage gp16-like protein